MNGTYQNQFYNTVIITTNTTQANTTRIVSECYFANEYFENILQPLSEEKKNADDAFPLSLNFMRKDQKTDTNLMKNVKKHIDKFGRDRYIYKEVEVMELIHKNDRILVP